MRTQDDIQEKEQPVLSKSIEIQSSIETDVSNDSPILPKNDIEVLLKEIIENVQMKDKTTPIRSEFITTKDHTIKFLLHYIVNINCQ